MDTKDFPGRGVENVGTATGSEAEYSPQWGMNAANVLPPPPFNKRPRGLRQTNLRLHSQGKFCVGRRTELDGKIWALKYILASLQQQWCLQRRQMLVLQRVSTKCSTGHRYYRLCKKLKFDLTLFVPAAPVVYKHFHFYIWTTRKRFFNSTGGSRIVRARSGNRHRQTTGTWSFGRIYSLRHDSFWMKMFRKKHDYEGVYYDYENDPTLINSTFRRSFRS